MVLRVWLLSSHNCREKKYSVIKEREFLPIYCEKKMAIYNREHDEIYSEIAETVPILVDLYLLLLEQ